MPTAAWATSVWGAHPEGDAVLFRPGAYELLTWLGDSGPALAATSRTSLVLALVSLVLGQLALGALLASLALGRDELLPPGEAAIVEAAGAASGDGGRSPQEKDSAVLALQSSAFGQRPKTALGLQPKPSEALYVGAKALVPMAVLFLAAAIVEGIIVGVGILLTGYLYNALALRLGDSPSFIVRMATLTCFILVACIAGVVFDVARAAAVLGCSPGGRGGSITKRAISTALVVARQALAAASIAWAWRAALGAIAVGLGYAASSALGGRGGIALVMLFAAHQFVVFVRVALRASWLARATRLAAYVHDART